jgi:hypothetical protein
MLLQHPSKQYKGSGSKAVFWSLVLLVIIGLAAWFALGMPVPTW